MATAGLYVRRQELSEWYSLARLRRSAVYSLGDDGRFHYRGRGDGPAGALVGGSAESGT